MANSPLNRSRAQAQQLAFDLDARLVPDREDCIWASAFFDGEGCVSMTRGSDRNVRAVVALTNTDLPTLEWYRDRWGGQIYTHKPGTHRQAAFQWQLGEARMPAFLEDIRPFMRIKVAQTDNCLAFLRLKGQRRKHSHLSAGEKVAYEEFLAAHRGLNLTHGGQGEHRPRIVTEPNDPRRSKRVG
jgi:hypothetical protein